MSQGPCPAVEPTPIGAEGSRPTSKSRDRSLREPPPSPDCARGGPPPANSRVVLGSLPPRADRTGLPQRAATCPTPYALAAAAGTRTSVRFSTSSRAGQMASDAPRPSRSLLCLGAPGSAARSHLCFSWSLVARGVWLFRKYYEKKWRVAYVPPRGFEVISETASMSSFRN